MNRAELGALRDAIDTILSWPDSVRDQIANGCSPTPRSPTPPIMVRLALVLAGTVASGQAWKKRRASGRSGRYPRPSRSWRRPVGEGNPVRKERGFHAAWPTGEARRRRA